jgi:putative transposase
VVVEHRHSSIQFATPAQRHNGEDRAILERRQAVYEAARAKNPARWSKNTRNWEWQSEVFLNPDKPTKTMPVSGSETIH